MDRTDAAIDALIDTAIAKELCEVQDKTYMINGLLTLLRKSTYTPPSEPLRDRSIPALLEILCDYAVANGILSEDNTSTRDLFSTALMGVLMPRPSSVIRRFRTDYSLSPATATDRFYRLCCDANYVMTERISRDLHWTSNSTYGKMDLSVNLSKPEKDPREIAAARLLPQTGYPLCALCHENEGFSGDLRHAARQTLRQIPLDLNGEQWYLQYSPYAYYNEHCIVLSDRHVPMKIDRSTFERQLAFVKQFPHYFIGSNADLPIVGGSILSHDHMQGGRASFPMERASIRQSIFFPDFPSIEAGIVHWPMSVVRLRTDDDAALVALADRILNKWRRYSDPAASVWAETESGMHNTVTPITRMAQDGRFEMDLVLRNNLTTPEHPDGLYHPHRDKHFIKKENIGLIEVMGLAILPARLKKELGLMRDALLSEAEIPADSPIAAFSEMAKTIRADKTLCKENVNQKICDAVGSVFTQVLEDAGVYKCTPVGTQAFLRFIDNVNI